MKEFMATLDEVKKYRRLVSSMTDFGIIILVSIIFAQLVNIIGNVLAVFFGFAVFPVGLVITPLVNFLFFFFGIIIGILWVDRRVKSMKGGEWKNTLDQGAPGAIKLLQELKWETILNDVRFAKLGFALYGALKLLAYWILTFFLFVLLWGFGRNIFHMSIDTISLVLLSLILVVVLNRKDLGERYEQVGRLDLLLWELRWFESEFRRADFKT